LALNFGERDRSVRSRPSIRIQRWRGSSAKEDILFENCTWINEPSKWCLASGALSVVTDSKTDFWRETHYGFVRHNGHCFGYRASGDFTATIRVRGRYRELYDQAGMMVLLDEQTWIKAGIGLLIAVLARSDLLLASRLLRQGLKKLAIYRDQSGQLHMHSANCPHLGCVVHWNRGEKTWDCPCHGSRFHALGHVVNGPANKRLAKAELVDSSIARVASIRCQPTRR
jgi:nitrite reductase/ring-hydroxylating ferredoxin subunit